MKRVYLILAPIIILCVSFGISYAEESEIAWTEGPATVDLKGDLAQIELGSDYIFTGAEGAKKIMEYIGNPPSDYEIGVIFPKDENKDWYVLFEYDPVGYIRDDDKDEIDADAILNGIKEATEEANKERQKQGFDPMEITGWYKAPYYDESTHNLTWAISANSGNGEVVNYNTRLLGRNGYTSVVLVTTSAELDQYRSDIQNILSSFSYREGKKYSEYVKGDKVAKYGLTALIAGGAGAAVAKTGLLKVLLKAWKAVVAGAVALFAGITGFIRRRFGNKK